LSESTKFLHRKAVSFPDVDQRLRKADNPHTHRANSIIFSFLYFFKKEEGAMMTDFLAEHYLWIKTLHVISVIAWMAGLFYLPRLYVYHAEQVEKGSPTDQMFQVMERRLLKAIINPASVGVWVFGLCMVFIPGLVDWSQIWPWTKAACVLAMTWFHHWLGWRRKDFIAGKNSLTGRQYRMMNEVPTLLMVIIVASVIVKF
jgi:protoporphyrinogen IX oxidase